MSRVLYIDCFSGASGDMLVGACLDAGLPLDALEEAIGGLALDGVSLDARRVVRSGIEGTSFRVLDESGHPVDGPHESGSSAHRHPHRHLKDVLRLLERARLSPRARTRAESLFRRLAEAEAAVHGIPVERVHFHEVGALDSIIDVVGAVFALEWFGADEIVASPLNTGSGTVRCAHGLMPVPAPATARLIAGVPVYAEGPQTELLTPTGALLVTGHAQRYGPLPPMVIERVGYGAGSRDFPDRPNLLRIVTGTMVQGGPVPVPAGPGSETRPVEPLLVLECELDDLNPQVFGVLMTRLLEAGARDVYYTPVQMKKGRPGTLVTVLADPGRREDLLDILFAETTTLGVRIQEAVREVLARESVVVTTSLGPVRVKLGRRRGRIVNVAPEFDDCAQLARAHGVPVKEVLAEALQAWRGGSGGAAS